MQVVVIEIIFFNFMLDYIIFSHWYNFNYLLKRDQRFLAEMRAEHYNKGLTLQNFLVSVCTCREMRRNANQTTLILYTTQNLVGTW